MRLSDIAAMGLKHWQAESARHVLWLPVCFAAGIAAYFAWPVEPSLLVPMAALIGATLLCVFCYRRMPALAIAVVIVAAGFMWAQIHTQQMHHTVLQQSLAPRYVTGIVNYIERTEHGVRLTLGSVSVKGLAANDTPENIRLTVRLKKDADVTLPHIGEAIGMMAGLRPPMGPALPNSFDFARYFYFRNIGAVGYGLPPWRIRSHQPATTLAEQFWDWRIRLTEEILRITGAETGGIAAGLITGDARAISEADFEALKASNLYHIIAISGEHMVVIAGVIFITLRLLALFALPKRVAFRPEVKTYAACVSLALVTAYLFVTGLPISAVRAYFMIFLVLLAVILRRQIHTMRSLSIAAWVMLLWDPASLLEPGFQLSFAATMAIIALVEIRHLQNTPNHDEKKPLKFFRVLFTLLLVSVVAEAATGPLVIAMFNSFSPYGILANMLAGLLVSFFLMPCVALYFVLLPLGLHPAALWLLDMGIRGLLAIAYWISSLPNAQIFLPSLPDVGVGLFVAGLLWLCLWRTPIRRFGVIAMVAGVVTIMLPTPPDVMVTEELKQIAFRGEGGYVQARGRRGTMIPNLWANGLGFKELAKASDTQWECMERKKNCIAHVPGLRIAFVDEDDMLPTFCDRAELVFSRMPQAACANGVRVINGTALSGSNMIALWIKSDKSLRLESSANWQGKRPWTALPANTEDEEL